jgi:hypothetical protein
MHASHNIEATLLQQAADADDAATLAQHVIAGIEANNDVNGASWDDWSDAMHAIETYLLDGTVTMSDDLCAEVPELVAARMSAELRGAN